MPIVSLKDAKAGMLGLMDDAAASAFVTIMQHGEPVTTLVPLAAVGNAREAHVDRGKPGLAAYLRTFPGDDVECDRTPSRNPDL